MTRHGHTSDSCNTKAILVSLCLHFYCNVAEARELKYFGGLLYPREGNEEEREIFVLEPSSFVLRAEDTCLTLVT